MLWYIWLSNIFIHFRENNFRLLEAHGEINFRQQSVNSSPPSVAYMRQWTGSSLVQVMACRPFAAKPLPEPFLAYRQLDSWEHISMKFESEFYHFHPRKCQNSGHFVQGCDELITGPLLGFVAVSLPRFYHLTWGDLRLIPQFCTKLNRTKPGERFAWRS